MEQDQWAEDAEWGVGLVDADSGEAHKGKEVEASDEGAAGTEA